MISHVWYRPLGSPSGLGFAPLLEGPPVPIGFTPKATLVQLHTTKGEDFTLYGWSSYLGTCPPTPHLELSETDKCLFLVEASSPRAFYPRDAFASSSI